MKRTEIFNGYIGKTCNVLEDKIASFSRIDETLSLDVELFDNKGNEADWRTQDWPPKKARITITLETGKDIK